MAELLLVLRIAGERVAFPASEVDSVVELESVTPVPGAPPHVAGLAALRSRVLTVVDCCVSLGFEPALSAEAVAVPCEGHLYALRVDAIEDVVEASAPAREVAAPLGPGWSRVARAMVEADGDLLLLVDPLALIAGPCREAA